MHVSQVQPVSSTPSPLFQSVERSVKLVNTSSLSVYQNYPSVVDKMSKPTDLDFSPNSGYFAVGTSKGVVHMYRLQHFNGY
ncbi:hypothetical protein EB796_002337 [Bugula neritina]|uniref:UTP18 n=1 Tax=Bugula neritina TaxID=10212 RepID=A0A7J7KMK2_BUGNE|nr:hypothetical protein EB796_002337 [Bugula neritina]